MQFLRVVKIFIKYVKIFKLSKKFVANRYAFIQALQHSCMNVEASLYLTDLYLKSALDPSVRSSSKLHLRNHKHKSYY